MPNLYFHNGATNTWLVEDGTSPTVTIWRNVPLGDSFFQTVKDSRLVGSRWDTATSAWIYGTNAIPFGTNDVTYWVNVYRSYTAATFATDTASRQYVTRTMAPPDGTVNLGQRYAVVALFMLLGAVFVLCYQAGRKGGK